MSAISDKIQKEQKELNVLKELSEKFPDLEEVRGRWTTFLSSKTINKIADQYTICHSCGCCDDAVAYVRPFIKVDNKYIYSSPYQFCIGNKNPGFPDYGKFYDIYYGWHKDLVRAEINPELISKIREELSKYSNE